MKPVTSSSVDHHLGLREVLVVVVVVVVFE
jgi:hypothetical protein